MTYEELKQFLTTQMRMSHIYQPLMIRRLLQVKGKSTDTDIAREILKYDPSQLEYYQKIVNNMPGRVLRDHGIVEKSKNEYKLFGFEKLTGSQIEELIAICNNKLTEYINKRGETIWSHRRKNRGFVSGSIRYEVLLRAKFRCELCGISAEEKALEVDHIVPKNMCGEDSINNYQALCYSCNSTKRDKDDTDVREHKEMYEKRDEGCLFCELDKKRIIIENNLAYLILDNYPVTENHCLIIPKRHFPSYFEIAQPEINAVNNLLLRGKEYIKSINSDITSYNIGINSGIDAGQTIMHCHIHLIPRYRGDVENPRGGVRHIIPKKGFY